MVAETNPRRIIILNELRKKNDGNNRLKKGSRLSIFGS